MLTDNQTIHISQEKVQTESKSNRENHQIILVIELTNISKTLYSNRAT